MTLTVNAFSKIPSSSDDAPVVSFNERVCIPGAISLPLTIVISPVWEILKNEEMSLFAISYLVIDT